MKRILSLVFVALQAAVIALFGYLVVQYFGLRERQGGPIMVIGHRGASKYAPENTISAFKLAIEQGADALELDVQQSADGELVVIHDNELDRTTNGIGWLGFYNFADLKQLDAGSWFDPLYKREKLPTLKETITTARERGVGTYIELKDPALYPGMAQRVADLLAAEGWTRPGQGIVISFDHAAISALRALNPELTLGVLFGPWRGPHWATAASLQAIGNPQLVLPHWASVLRDPYMVRRLHRLGKLVVVWTADAPWAARMLQYVGVDGIITNNPDLVIAATAPLAEVV